MFSASRSGARSRIPNAEGSSYRPRSFSINTYSRDSYGSNVRRASSEERKSISSINRRFSGVRNSLEHKGSVKDPRPLVDKEYKNKKLTELCQFLSEQGFPQQITPAKLIQPSKREYELIFQFLVQFWEPTFQVKNLEEDAPRVLKSLGYLYIPNKSVFSHVARTNFSALFGILLFLMDFAKFVLHVDLSNLLETGDSERPAEHAEVLNTIFGCYRDVKDEEFFQAFQDIIRKREELKHLDQQVQERNSIKQKLENIQKDLDNIAQLKDQIQILNSKIEKYEEYFLDMEKYKEKREATMAKHVKDAEEKRAIVRDLSEKLIQKQALYDAQGFDGKKHVSHFEELKKNLTKTLEEKRSIFRELQDECWQLELTHSQHIDKGGELCKNFNHVYSQVQDASNAILDTLQNIRDDSIVQDVRNSLRIEFPECPKQFNQRTLLAWNDTHKESLEEIQKKMYHANLNIISTFTTKSQKLTEVEMKKLQLSRKLQCSSSVDQKKEDLENLNKQAIEEVRVIGQKILEVSACVEKLRKENGDKKSHLRSLLADLQEVEELKSSKTIMLEKYKEEQKKWVANLHHRLESIENHSEECFKEIAAVLEKKIKELKEVQLNEEEMCNFDAFLKLLMFD